MDEDTPPRPQGLALLWHGLAPTAFGVVCYVILAVLLVGLHVLALSVGGKAFPASFDDVVLQGYTNVIIQPLTAAAYNQSLNTALTIILWGLGGWLVCFVVAGIAKVINDWHNTEDDITMPREGVVVRHPLQRSFVVRMLWRLFIGIVLIMFTALTLPIVQFCFRTDIRAVHSTSLAWSMALAALTVLIWVIIFHCYVVLFRLYMLRTRVFGELLY